MKPLTLALLIAVASVGAASAQESDDQTPSAETLQETIVCPNLDDLQHAQMLGVGRTLLASLAALRYALDHGCTSLDKNTFVKVDGRTGVDVNVGESGYACIRPRRWQTCFWTFADNIKINVQ
jgi:hypothetical protein